jgi:hypothetical protein
MVADAERPEEDGEEGGLGGEVSPGECRVTETWSREVAMIGAYRAWLQSTEYIYDG